jgi:hypothetical protein
MVSILQFAGEQERKEPPGQKVDPKSEEGAEKKVKEA